MNKVCAPPGAWEYASRDGVFLSSQGLPLPFRRAFLRVAVSTRGYFDSLFGTGAVPEIEFNVRKRRGLPLRLWTNGADRIYLTLSRKSQLGATPKSGVRHIHGVAHELAHIVLYRSIINLQELSDGWGEGWAVYLASFWAVPWLFKRHGERLWPHPYDYRRYDGPDGYLQRFRSLAAAPDDLVLRAVYDLHRLERHLGRKGFISLFRSLLRHRVRADHFNARIARELRGLPGDRT